MPVTHEALPYLREILIFLALAGVLIPLLQRYRVNKMLGFLATGVLLGPFGLWLWVGHLPWLQNFTFVRVEGVVELGHLGVLFLMFSIGLELSAERLWGLRHWVFGAGTAQVLLSASLLGAVAVLLDQPPEVAILLGLLFSLSSTAVVIQWMTDHHLLSQPHGMASFSILMFQDLAVVPILIMTGLLAHGATPNWLGLMSMVLFKSVAAILLIYLVGRRLFRPCFKALAREHQPSTFVALVLLSTLGVAGLTEWAGLSMALGAFLAGLVLAETEFRHEIEVTIEPFKSLLLGLFFMAVGMQTDMRLMIDSPWMIPLLVVGLFVIKALVLTPILKLGGLSWGHAIESSLMMSQGGEFAFVVAADATAKGLFSAELAHLVLLIVSLSMFAAPVVARMGHIIGRWWDHHHHPLDARLELAEVAPLENHVIIVGFGRMGQLLAEVLTSQKIHYVAIDIDMMRSTQKHSLGQPVYLGDVSRPKLLHRVHASTARAIVLTMDHPDATLNAACAIHKEFPHVPLLARAHDEQHAKTLLRAGATWVTPEALEAGLQLSAYVLETLGIERTQAAEAIRKERAMRLGQVNDRRNVPT